MYPQHDHKPLPVPVNIPETPLAWSGSVPNPTTDGLSRFDALELAPPGYDHKAARPHVTLAPLDALEAAPPAIENEYRRNSRS
jgi:hypothetical protein